MNKLKQIPEFLRFVMVGLFATGLHYGIYFVLQKFIQVKSIFWSARKCYPKDTILKTWGSSSC